MLALIYVFIVCIGESATVLLLTPKFVLASPLSKQAQWDWSFNN